MRFTRLKLSGFKSFVESAELLIEPGLTGIVGPNGCGKSNLVEALRWVMGESSARQLRGGEMDDVIFAGTAQRPPRNIAEVALHLDNSDRAAPAAVNDGDEIEVVRRIERGSGSAYRVNGRELRARDVQTLFADAASGARSAAMVGQGEVAAVIAAKPAQRRHLLEEAAGITGLHARRHEAELRLHAAETNLERLDDVLAGLESQLAGLRRQARQAARYRSLSERLRRAEAMLLHRRWTAAEGEVAAAAAALDSAEAAVADRTGAAARAATLRTEAAASLPGLRDAEAEAGASLHRLSLARDGLDAEAGRIAEAARAVEARLAQIADDIRNADVLAADAGEAVTRLEDERHRLTEARTGEEAAVHDAADARAHADQAVNRLEAEVAGLTERVAAGEARRADLDRRLEEIESRIGRLEQRRQALAEERERIVGQAVAVADDSAVAAAQQAAEARNQEAEAASAATRATEEARSTAEAAERAARDNAHAADAARSRTAAEADALTAVLAGGPTASGPPIIDSVTVEAGYEAALGAALGDDLDASQDDSAAARWRTLPPLAEPPPLPAGAVALADHVQAPAALARRLGLIGVVEEEHGAVLQQGLAPGQRLVSRSGALWRWDGYTAAADAPPAATVRLTQRNRLEELRADLAEKDAAVMLARTRLGEAETAAAQARDASHTAAERERQLRDAARQADRAVAEAREAHGRAQAAAAAHASKLAAHEDSERQVAADLADAEAARADARAAVAGLPDPARDRSALADARAAIAEARQKQSECHARHDRLVREAAARRDRLAAIATETAAWRRRAESAEARRAELDRRRREAEAERLALAARPAEIAARRTVLLDRIETAETERRNAADRLAEADAALAAHDRAAREADAALAAAREQRVREEGRLEQARRLLQVEAERIAERLGCRPEQLAMEIGGDGPLPAIEALEAQIDRLSRERDGIGPVNLRAEVEAGELQERIAGLAAERADLVAAISRLRSGIASLNSEARERLLAAFGEVDRHFQAMFQRLFGGGGARLELTDGEDPLQSGLEILASPPGKRLQMLSLLSGGEQALAALALMFAVFLTRPAPVCVLDEVDAPLDDANVDRFCNLVEELSRSLRTRFLIVTHHALTMARMDRLFGVTMVERGISQLVSVNLRQADALRAAE